MTKKTTAYTIAAPEGLAFVTARADTGAKPLNVGDKVTLDLPDETELAVLAAGWLTTDDTTTSKGGRQ